MIILVLHNGTVLNGVRSRSVSVLLCFPLCAVCVARALSWCRARPTGGAAAPLSAVFFFFSERALSEKRSRCFFLW